MKLAILGSGMIVQDFLSFSQEITGIELKALIGTQRSLEKLHYLQELYQIDNIYTDFEVCLTESDFDTVYIGVPNHLHFSYAKQALEAGKNVICEKPFTLKLAEMQELKALALAKDLVLVEAITNQYLANFRKIKQDMYTLGELKLLECNYSQYSSRYDAFKRGEILPAFNPKFGGGALMDINIYNVHLVVGLLGEPQKVNYYANITNQIDTSGILVMDYGYAKAVCIGAKDSSSIIRSTIQGDQGSLIIEGPTNGLDYYQKLLNGQAAEKIDCKVHSHRMYEEFVEFERIIATHDMEKVKEMLEHSEIVMKVVEAALEDAEIKLG